jgi:uncharacterized protein DUF4389
MGVPATPYPATLTYEPAERVDNWRPLVQWFLAIPQLIVVSVLGTVSNVLSLVSWFAILFTGRLPQGIADFQALYLRYNVRVMFYAGFLTTGYPPFAFDTGGADPGTYPAARVDVTPALEDRNRLTSFFRLLLAIPHLVVLFVLTLVSGILWFVAGIAVLFTGRWPEGIRNFVLGVQRWSLRFSAYTSLLTDEYPPFSLD